MAAQQIGAARGQVPPEMLPVMEWAESYVQSRLDRLKGGEM
jgi:hypothetical protein